MCYPLLHPKDLLHYLTPSVQQRSLTQTNILTIPSVSLHSVSSSNFLPHLDSELLPSVLWPSSQRIHQSTHYVQHSVKSCTPALTTVDEKLTVSTLSFVPIVSPTARQKNRGNPARETEREREQAEAGREGCKD